MPILEQVTIPWVNQHMENGRFDATEPHEQSAVVMLDELHRWAQALRPMRAD